MGDDITTGSDESPVGGAPGDEGAAVDSRESSGSRGGMLWLKLALVALASAVVAALVAANWASRHFSLVFVDVNVKAGLVILASVALGFLLGFFFLWSALTRD